MGRDISIPINSAVTQCRRGISPESSKACQTSGQQFHALCAALPTSPLCTTKMAVKQAKKTVPGQQNTFKIFLFLDLNLLLSFNLYDFTQTNFVAPIEVPVKIEHVAGETGISFDVIFLRN